MTVEVPFLILASLIILAFIIIFSFVPIGLWISAIASGVSVSITGLIGMRLRRISPKRIIEPMIKAHKADIKVSQNQLEAHYLAGGNVDSVVDALIAADKAQIPLPFDRAAAIDLAGRRVLEAVQTSVNPKVIATPECSRSGKRWHTAYLYRSSDCTLKLRAFDWWCW